MSLRHKFFSNLELDKDKPMQPLKRCFSSDIAFGMQPIVELPLERAHMTDSHRIMIREECIVFLGSKDGRFGAVNVALKTAPGLCVSLKEYKEVYHDLILSGMKVGSKMNTILAFNHSCIIKSFEIGKWRKTNTVFRSMEDMPGNIYDEIEKTGPFDEEGIKIVLMQVCRALEYLHVGRLVHGTLHTKNIFIKDAFVKVSDAEGSLLLEWLPYSRTPLDLLPFQAPELKDQLKNVTPECDLWSLGVCLHAMATGFLPFTAGTRQEMVRKIQTGLNSSPFCTGMTDPSFKVEKLSEKVQALIIGMIRVNPAERLTASDLVEDEWVFSDKVWPTLVELHANMVKDLKRSMAAKLLEASNPVAIPTKTVAKLPEFVRKPIRSVVIASKPTTRDSPKPSIQSADEGYSSEREAPPQDDGEGKPVETDEMQGKTHKHIAVLVVENVRQECDNVLRIERCSLKVGTICLKIIIPAADDTPSLFQRLKTNFEKFRQRFRSNQDTVQDLQFGDYALMNFGRNKTEMESGRNFPKFANRREAHLYFCKIEAERLWETIGVCVCMKCRRAGTEAKVHDQAMCLYKLLAEATETDEVIYYGEEDQFHMKSFKLVYREEGDVAPVARSRKTPIQYLRTGCRVIANRIRRKTPTN